MAARQRRRNRLDPDSAPADYPRYLDGATDFGAHADELHPLWVVKTLQRYPQYWDALRDATDGAQPTFGRSRMGGHWALPYPAFVFSRHADVKPWWQSAGHSIWRNSGFAERPSYPVCQRRFAELEQHADAFEACARKLIQRAVKASGGQIGRHLHVDATEAETHARLEHICPDWSDCQRDNGRKNGSRVTAGESMNAVREERHRRAEAPEPEGDAFTAPEIGEADELRRTETSLKVRVGGCWWEVLDPTAGVRAYGKGSKVKKFWVGFYNHKAIDHYVGAPVAVHITSSSLQEHLAYPQLFQKVVAATGVTPTAMVADRGYSISSVFEFNTRRGVGSIMPWRAHGSWLKREMEDTDTHDRHGIVRCKHCGSPTRFVSFTRTAGGDRGPRLYVICEGKTFDACAKRQSIGCEVNWRMLLPMWRTSPTYLALRHSHDRYERVHHHWRVRYRVGSDDHALRPKRRGLDCQQLRANAALVIEWLIINWREGWLPRMSRAELNGRVLVEDGRAYVDSLKDLRRDLGLDHPYGPNAVKAKIGEQQPVPGKRVAVPLQEADPSEPEEPAVIPPTDGSDGELGSADDLPF